MDKLVRAVGLGNVQLPVFALAWFVSAAFAVLVGVAMPLAGSVRRLGALVTCGVVGISRIVGTRPPGCLRLAARRARGPRPPPGRPRRRHPRAGLGVLHGQAEGNPDEGPEQRADHNQELAAMAKRSVHIASKLEPTLSRLPFPEERKPEGARRSSCRSQIHRAGCVLDDRPTLSR